MKYVLGFYFIALSFSCKAKYRETSITQIDTVTLQEAIKHQDIQLIDVRTPKEYNLGHIGKAINIAISDKDNFIKGINNLDKQKPIYLYCYSGPRSKRASKILMSFGFLEIYDYSEGWKVWSRAHLLDD